MVAVSGSALWLGGVVWAIFVLAVCVGVLWEWNKLARKIASSRWARLLWLTCGVIYVGVGGEVLVTMPQMFGKLGPLIPGAGDRDRCGRLFRRAHFGRAQDRTLRQPFQDMVRFGRGQRAGRADLDRSGICCGGFGAGGAGAIMLRLALAGVAVAVIAQIGDFSKAG
jgi:phosphatidate cytidylyltransferase